MNNTGEGDATSNDAVDCRGRLDDMGTFVSVFVLSVWCTHDSYAPQYRGSAGLIWDT